MFALDANTLIYFFKGIGSVKDHLLGVRPADIGIPSVVLYDSRSASGNQRSPRVAVRNSMTCSPW
jgi:tRNA(fMet)-specific endonuclease VapC